MKLIQRLCQEVCSKSTFHRFVTADNIILKSRNGKFIISNSSKCTHTAFTSEEKLFLLSKTNKKFIKNYITGSGSHLRTIAAKYKEDITSRSPTGGWKILQDAVLEDMWMKRFIKRHALSL